MSRSLACCEPIWPSLGARIPDYNTVLLTPGLSPGHQFLRVHYSVAWSQLQLNYIEAYRVCDMLFN